MADRLSLIEAKLHEMDASIALLARRIDGLQEALRQSGLETITQETLEPGVSVAPAVAQSEPGRADATRLIVLVGRTCIVFGGAFLLRALTESGRVPSSTGVWLGLAYGLTWLIVADRARGASAMFHGITALLITLPLVLEAATRFQVLTSVGSAIALGATGLAAMAVAWRQRMHELAGAALLGGIATSFALALVVGAWAPYALLLIVLGIGALWIGYARDWPWLAWPAAAAATLATVAVAVRASATPAREEPLLALALHALLIAAYLGSFLLRVVLHDRHVGAFEVTQTAVALTVGLVGAFTVASARGLSTVSIGIPALIAGTVLYIQTFGRVAARRGLGRTFYFTGMTALALTLAGISLLVPAPWQSVVIASGSLAVGLLAWWVRHPMLALQGGISAVVAAAQSGLVGMATRTWLGTFDVWPSIAAPIWVVLAAAATALAIPRTERREEPASLVSAARISLAVAAAVGLASVVLTGVGRLVTDSPIDRGVVATLRTVVLAAAAVALAAGGRTRRFAELGWLVYPILAIGALKILGEDLRLSDPATLFVALALYGVALIAAPKVLKRA